MGVKRRVVFRLSNHLFITVVLTALTGFACSQGTDIHLKGALPGPERGAESDSSPSSPTTPSSDPTGPSVNSPVATPTAPLYRMFCDERYPPYLTTVSSMASPVGLGAGLETGELNARGKFDPQVDRNLEYHEHAQVVRLPKFGEARILFSARKRPAAGNTAYGYARFIFVSDVEVSVRGGAATRLAPELAASSAIRAYGETELFSARTFGASDKGRFILIGQADGYRLIDSKTLKNLGTIKTGSADSNVNPELRESDMIFSVAGFKGGTFESKLYSIGLTSTGALKSATLVASAGGLRRPLQSIGPAPGESFAALDSKNRIVTLSPLRAGGGAKAVKVQAVPVKGRLSSAVAAWRDAASGEIQAVVVFENFIAVRGGISDSYKIEQVFVRVVRVDESSLSADAIVPDFEYPPEARSAVEQSSSSYRRTGVSEMMTTPDGEAVFGLFPGGLANNVYRLTTNGFIRVSRAECSKLDIGLETAGVQP